jgi:hypothetical protein
MVQETIMRIPAFQKHVAELREKETLDELRARAPEPGLASTLMALPGAQKKKR